MVINVSGSYCWLVISGYCYYSNITNSGRYLILLYEWLLKTMVIGYYSLPLLNIGLK